MPVKMQPTSSIKVNLGINPNGKIMKFLTSECAKAMDKYVPMDNGDLRKYKIRGNLIIYGDGPSNAYARYQYHGVREDGTHKVNNYTTPGTGPYWDQRMITADLPDIIKRVQDKFGGR